ncbi:MAG: hydroxyphenylacetyl-CoA thioesterase PaaI [Woeseia sp.]
MNDLSRARECARTMYDADRASRELGITIDVTTPGHATAVMPVTGSMLNGHDVCHGGYLFTLADTAFAFACNGYNDVTVAAAASIDFLRPAKDGDRLTATASERHRQGRTGIYDVEITNQRGERVALFRGKSFATGEPMLRAGRGAP